MLEIKAVSLESIGSIDKSAEVYEKLFALTQNNFHGYSLAKLQFGLKSYQEAYKTIQKVEGLMTQAPIRLILSSTRIKHNRSSFWEPFPISRD